MFKAISLICILTFISLHSDSQELLNAVKGKKNREAAKEINSKIPTAAQWTANVDRLIDNKDTQGLLALQWKYRFIDVYGYGESDYSTETAIPVLHNEDPMVFGGSEQLYKQYFVKVGVALAELGQLSFVLSEYLDSSDQVSISSGHTYWEFIQLLCEGIDAHFVSQGSNIDQEATLMLKNESIASETRRDCAETLIHYYSNENKKCSDELNKAVLAFYDEFFVRYTDFGPFLMQYWAKVDFRDAIPHLIKTLSSDIPKTRITAIQALGDMHAKEALSKLEIIAENDSFYYIDEYGNRIFEIREVAEQAIQAIELAE